LRLRETLVEFLARERRLPLCAEDPVDVQAQRRERGLELMRRDREEVVANRESVL
jgi:hypothetical protein